MLSEAQIKARAGKLTASQVGCLMTGDQDKILNLWRLHIGDPSYVKEDLSLVFAVQLGSITEPLNLRWFEVVTGRKLSRLGETVVHPTASWAACTLDGWDDSIPCPVEAKHVGGFEPRSRIIQRYTAQATWQMLVTDTKKCVLSIIEGARAPVLEVVDYDQIYADELWSRAVAFMAAVHSLTPPCAMPAVVPPVRAEKTYDMSGSNSWGSEAVAWLEAYPYARKAAAAEKNLKSLVPSDAARCSGHGIVVTRDSRGYLSLREQKS